MEVSLILWEEPRASGFEKSVRIMSNFNATAVERGAIAAFGNGA